MLSIGNTYKCKSQLIYTITATHISMEEIKNFIKVWTIGLALLSFCYFVIKQIPRGVARVISLLPIICIFLYLPLTLTSIHFIIIAFFYFTWLASFKLLLFAFNKGPIGDPYLHFKDFILLCCLPININPTKPLSDNGFKSPYNYLTKALLLGILLNCYKYQPFLHPYVILVTYCAYLYLALELTLVVSAYPVRALFGIEIEPQFQEPFLSTSIQDFWGRRWNLMVPTILRPSVYLPVRNLCTPLLGRKPALVIAVFTTFAVSSLMHELLWYYITLVTPTWELTSFFMLHGVCTGVEILVKRAVGDRWRLHPVISIVLADTFMVVTGSWLIFTPVMKKRLDVRMFQEYITLGNVVKEAVGVHLSSK